MHIFDESASARCITITALLALLAGCGTRTPFKLPDSGLPETWSHGSVSQDSIPAISVSAMPAAFRQDERLNSLLAVVASSNRELAATAFRVRKAQLQAELAGNALWPQPTAGLTVNRSRSLRQGGPTTVGYSANASVAYEVDLWNKLGTERDMAIWQAHATEQDRRNVRMALSATTSALYFRLGLLNDRTRSSAASLDNARRTLGLVQAQYTYGASSALELAEARQVVRGQDAAMAQLVQQRVEARNALTLLADGRDLSAYVHWSIPVYEVMPMPAGLPVTLLSQRPDLRAAEIRLRRSLASVDVARVSFYPTFSLTVSGGGSSNELQRMLSNPIGTLAANITFPFLNAGRARLTTAIAQAEFDEASLLFQQAMQTAFTEVDNALSSGVQLREEQMQLEASLEDARIAERLYEARYREGTVALRDWISAQERRRQADVAVLDNRYNRFANAITVLKTMGSALHTE